MPAARTLIRTRELFDKKIKLRIFTVFLSSKKKRVSLAPGDAGAAADKTSDEFATTMINKRGEFAREIAEFMLY